MSIGLLDAFRLMLSTLHVISNTVVESYDVTFDETTLYPRDVFECASDKEMEESIFVDE
jgi:hypothetical protein